MPKTKCFHCGKKIGVIKFECKCSTLKLCSKCRLPENHNCQFDYVNENKIKLNDKLVKVDFKKVIEI